MRITDSVDIQPDARSSTAKKLASAMHFAVGILLLPSPNSKLTSITVPNSVPIVLYLSFLVGVLLLFFASR
jgi:hypothetical protein